MIKHGMSVPINCCGPESYDVQLTGPDKASVA